MLSAVTTEGEFTAGSYNGLFGDSSQSMPLLWLTRYITEFYLGTLSSEKFQTAKKKELVRDTVKAIKNMGSPVK